MNATIESLFGPPSDKIDVPAFIQTAAQTDYEPVLDLPQSSVAQECSVSSIKDSIFNTWNNPTLSAYLVKDNENTLMSLYSFAPIKSAKTKIKNNSIILDSATSALKANLDAVKLNAYRTKAESSTFIRPSRNSDHNALSQVRPAPEPSAQIGSAKEAIFIVSVHTKSPWASGNANRSSQHALLSSQTLADLLKIIPCRSNEIEDIQDLGTETRQTYSSQDCFICIEELVYADAVGDQGYAQKLISHVQSVSKGSPAIFKAPTTIHETHLSSLSLRINQPYWIVHKGNCEHFLVVDQIRFQHPSDIRSGYPMTLQITPPLLDLCRVCTKVPAVLAITGDVRLGESPCLLCKSCWRHMGEPPSDSDIDVVVKGLPRYDLGWRSSS